MISAFEQNLLFGATALIGLGTVVVLAWQAVRYFRRRDDD